MIEPLFSALIALFVAILWGVNSLFLKLGMRGEDPMRALFIRTLFTFPILFIFVYIVYDVEGITIYFSRELLPLVLLTSMLIVIGDGIFLLSLKSYDVSQILPVASIYPFFTTMILLSTGIEQISLKIIIGTIIIILGVGVVTGAKGKAEFSPKVILYGVSIAVCWGTSIFFVRNILDDPSSEAFGLTGVRTMFMGVFGYLIYLTKSKTTKQSKDLQYNKRSSIFYLALSGIIGWVIGASLFFVAVQRIGAAIPTPISSTNPIFASLIGIYFGVEKVNSKQFFGIILSVIGTIVIVI